MLPCEGEAGLFLLLLFWVLSDEQLEFCEHTACPCSSVRLLLSNCSASSSRHLNKYIPLDSWVALSNPGLLDSFFAFFSSLLFSFFSLFFSFFFSALAISLSLWSFRAPEDNKFRIEGERRWIQHDHEDIAQLRSHWSFITSKRHVWSNKHVLGSQHRLESIWQNTVTQHSVS